MIDSSLQAFLDVWNAAPEGIQVHMTWVGEGGVMFVCPCIKFVDEEGNVYEDEFIAVRPMASGSA